MNCVNLLAFIQIAVAFDFGLIYLSNTHIFTNLVSSFLDELAQSCSDLLSSSENLCNPVKKYKELALRRERAILVDSTNKLKWLLDPKNVRWDKYAYTGVYSGVYGLLCLLMIGLTGCENEHIIRNFLLISGEIILVFQFVNLIQLSKIGEKKISIVKIISRLWGLFIILVVSFIIVVLGCWYPFWTDFNVPFVILSTAIVYFPVGVYVYRILRIQYEITHLKGECSVTIERMNSLLS